MRALGVATAHSREVVGHARDAVMAQACEQADVPWREVWTAPIHRVIDLAAKVFVVLSGEAGYGFRRITLRDDSMASPTQARIGVGTLADEAAISVADRKVPIEVADTGGHISDRLRIRQIVAIRDVLHAQIPASIVSVVDELFPENRGVLAGDARPLSVQRASPVGSVASHMC